MYEPFSTKKEYSDSFWYKEAHALAEYLNKTDFHCHIHTDENNKYLQKFIEWPIIVIDCNVTGKSEIKEYVPKYLWMYIRKPPKSEGFEGKYILDFC